MIIYRGKEVASVKSRICDRPAAAGLAMTEMSYLVVREMAGWTHWTLPNLLNIYNVVRLAYHQSGS